MPHDKTPFKNGENSKYNNKEETNSPKMPVLKEYIIIGGVFILPPQEYDVNMPQNKIPGKTGENSEPNKYGDPNSPKISFFI